MLKFVLGIGRSSAFPLLESLGKRMESVGFKVPRFIREFGVYDSDVSIDVGWLEPLPSGSRNIGFVVPFHDDQNV